VQVMTSSSDQSTDLIIRLEASMIQLSTAKMSGARVWLGIQCIRQLVNFGVHFAHEGDKV